MTFVLMCGYSSQICKSKYLKFLPGSVAVKLSETGNVNKVTGTR